MKLQINKKVTNAKSALFAVVDSLNFYIQPESLKELNVPKLADSIVAETRKQFGEQFTKANLETVLNSKIKDMTTQTKPVAKADKSTQATATTKKEIQITDDDMKIIKNESESFNKRVAQLPHLWDHQAVLSKAFNKSRQRVINAIKIAKNKGK